jgi:hypothetical protein
MMTCFKELVSARPCGSSIPLDLFRESRMVFLRKCPCEASAHYIKFQAHEICLPSPHSSPAAELQFAIGAITMRKMIRRVTLTSVVIFVYSGLLPNPVNGGPSESSILEPASGALFGLYYGAGSLAQTAAKLGRTPAVHLTYYAWAAAWTGSVTKADLAEGRIPLVNWEPHHIDFAKIIDGSLDATIMERANSSKALGKKLFLDFAAEMNGDEAWSGNNAQLYVSAYRHIHELFVAAGASNVVWVWCPNVTDTAGGNRTTMD